MSWPRLADISRLPLPGTELPQAVRFVPGRAALTYLQADHGSLVQSLWLHDLGTGERTLLAGAPSDSGSEERLSHEERLRRERRRTSELGVTDYAWLAGGRPPILLAPMGGRAHAAAADALQDGLRPVAGVERADSVIGSPDGSNVAFVRDGDIWIAPVSGGSAARLTDDAERGVFNGTAEYVAAEELDRFDGMWWSHDGRHLAFAHVDERDVPVLSIPHLGDPAPRHEEHRYPFAGGPNAAVTLRIASPEEATWREVPLPMAPGDYLARVVAHPLGGWLAAVLPRDQRSLTWLRVEPDGGVAALWTETSDPWLNLDHDTRILADGRILRTTERSGHRHLELREPGGERLAVLTAGEWSVRSVAHVDPAAGEVLFHAHADGPTEQHLYRVPLEPRQPVTDPERMSSEPGWHQFAFSPDGTSWADAWSDLRSGPRLVVGRREHGALAASQPRTLTGPLATARSLGIEPPELMQLHAADGSTAVSAALYRPHGRAAAAPPCVVWVYGGPHAQYVRRDWATAIHPLRQYLVRAGTAVLVVDGRGSAFRGLAFESVLDGELGTTEVADQAAAVRQLAERGEIDASRVGITGGSYGGFLTIRAMALEPGLFRVGVAVAPVTFWDGYDTAYTERYLDMPHERPEAYAASSALAVADRIRGDLLLIHGAVDENVHLRHSVRMVAAFQAASREVQLILLPDDRHRIRTPAGLRARDSATVRHLLGGLGLPLTDELEEAEGAEGQAAAAS